MSPDERLIRIAESSVIHYGTVTGSYVKLRCGGRNVRTSRLAPVGTHDVVTCRSCIGRTHGTIGPWVESECAV